MEYTDYWVVPGEAAAVRDLLCEVGDAGLVLDDAGSGLVVFVLEGHSSLDGDNADLAKRFDWLLGIWDAEGGAWGFELYAAGKSIAAATWGENAEWGIDESMNGTEGDLAEAAKVLGTKTRKLEACMNDEGVERFCKAAGFEHHYTLYPRKLPDGVRLLSEII